MQIKKFVGTTLKEATERMRAELGPDAIILNTRKVTSNKLLNFAGKEMLEITAAIDDVPGHPARHSVSETRTFSQLVDKAREAYGVAPVSSDYKHTQHEPDTVLKQRKNILPESPEIIMLRNEVEEMKQVLTQIAEHIKYTKMPALPLQLQKIYIELINNDVDEKIAADVIQLAYAHLTPSQYEDKRTVEQVVINELSRMITTQQLPTEHQKKAYIVAMVGPTGVGKTTTIAKLAAIHKLVYHQNVALVTADTYRIGAIEQLRTFAGIAEIPMQVVYQPKDMEAALKAFKKKRPDFIDTVGRNQRAKKELNELKKFLDAADPDEIHLVLNASAGTKQLLDIIEHFKTLKPNRYLFSKVDEAMTMGSIAHIIRKHRVPISYITNGQVVPDDIRTINATQFAALICGVNAHA